MSILIETNNLNIKLQKKQILKDVAIQVKQGEIYGLIGPSGAGKTTLVKAIIGMEKASSGEVIVLDAKMPTLTVMKKIGYMAQSDALYTELTAYENLDFFASLYGLKKTYKKERIAYAAEIVGLTAEMKKKVADFSGGMKRRLSLAIALLVDPAVLILDEPTVGIDPELRKSIWEELRKLKESGKGILVTTHVMDEAEKCDRLTMIREGRVIATGSPQALKEQTHSAELEEAFLRFGRDE
ncbi:ABC transporter ATP-binding protein [Listeria grayi]|uniref:ABC transporter ATP-binding protein n=1 Tax=Listeria grayi TaxID=1641 RepID=UPI00162A5126|nr:ABC transporter ATP-binding protein [Listeria grayi]MBC1922588.1 ABC transporter ATP-binding protein [Listeria grayi]